MNVIAQFENWSFRYRGSERVAVEGVTFSLRAGEVLLLAGASGSGKSTLLRALAGVLLPGESSGECRVSVERIAYVQQDPSSSAVMSRVDDDIAFAAENRGWTAARISRAVNESASAAGVLAYSQRTISTLSGGERQRVSLAAARVVTPDLLLLDEPTSMLDGDGVASVKTAITEAASSGCAVVLVEHHVAEVLDIVDRVMVVGTDFVGSPRDFETRAEEFTALGVWVPGADPVVRAAGNPGDAVLWSAEVTLHAGEVVALSGPNGAGKTTRLRTLAGLGSDTATASTQLANGLEANPARWSAADLSRRMGFMLQNPEHLFLHDTVSAELPDKDLQVRFGLEHLVDSHPFALSGGEQRRLAFAIEFAKRAPVLLLDEPTFGLDAQAWEVVVDAIDEERRRGVAVAVATHDNQLLHALQPRVILCNDSPREAANETDKLRLKCDPLSLLMAVTFIAVSGLLVRNEISLGVSLAGALALCLLARVLPWRRIAISSLGLAGVVVANLPTATVEEALFAAARVAVVVIPGVVLLPRLDATGLADALAQRWRLKPRFVLSALGAFRLLEDLRGDWLNLAFARRIRGQVATGPRTKLVQFANDTFRLLVSALRRAERLSLSLSSRGLTDARSWWRTSSVSGNDRVLVLLCALVPLAVMLTR